MNSNKNSSNNRSPCSGKRDLAAVLQKAAVPGFRSRRQRCLKRVVCMGVYTGYRENGKENGNCYLGFRV